MTKIHRLQWEPRRSGPVGPASLVREELDLPLSLEVLPWVIDQLESEAIPVVVESTSTGWTASALSTLELASLVEQARAAWVVQRASGDGLLTRVVLLDELGQPLAWISAPLGAGEPVGWRVILLRAIIASQPDL